MALAWLILAPVAEDGLEEGVGDRFDAGWQRRVPERRRPRGVMSHAAVFRTVAAGQVAPPRLNGLLPLSHPGNVVTQRISDRY